MNVKRVVVLGSTGSIGESALRVVSNANREQKTFEVLALSASGNRLTRLKEQCLIYRPKYLLLENQSAVRAMSGELGDVRVLHVDDGHRLIAEREKVDVCVVGTVGIDGLRAVFDLASCCRVMAVANKEAIVYGGQMMLGYLARHECRLIPVDSEHNSLYQILEGTNRRSVAKVIITASGGSLREYSGDLADVTVKQALSHPKWQMGHKCTIDSANLINKGIELIEASILFNIPPSKVDAVIHPQALVHAMVEMVDGGMISFMSNPDMALHLAHAMHEKSAKTGMVDPIDFSRPVSMDFFEIDHERFPGIKIARQALESGRSHVVALNAADAVLVDAFVDGKIRFDQITQIIEETLCRVLPVDLSSVDDVIDYDGQIKRLTRDVVDMLV